MGRSLRALLGAVVVVLLAVGGAVLILILLSSRDASPLTSPSGSVQSGPLRGPAARHALPTSGAHQAVAITRDEAPISDDALLEALSRGDVVLIYGAQRPPPGLRALALALAPPFSPALAAAGGAVILTPRPGTPGVVALAWRHQLRVAQANDPALRAFADFWLGRGSGGNTPSG